jgi:hypothetical protein
LACQNGLLDSLVSNAGYPVGCITIDSRSAAHPGPAHCLTPVGVECFGQRDKSADPETMIWLYLGNGTVGVMAVVVTQSILSYGFAILLFQSQLQTYLDGWARQDSTNSLERIHANDIPDEGVREDVASRWQYLVFLALTSFVTVGISEEGLGYCSLVYIRRSRAVVAESGYITYAVASALGLSTIENIAFIYEASQVGKPACSHPLRGCGCGRNRARDDELFTGDQRAPP